MDVKDLIQLKEKIQSAVETDGLDFKKSIEESSKGQADLVKDIAALSNFGGGMLIALIVIGLWPRAVPVESPHNVSPGGTSESEKKPFARGAT